MKTIVIACGTGAVSSALINSALEELLGRHGVEAKLIRCRCDQLRRYQGRADLIVTSVTVPGPLPVPVVLGTPLITGRGTAQLEQSILNALGEGS